jgi:hypothetical protein
MSDRVTSQSDSLKPSMQYEARMTSQVFGIYVHGFALQRNTQSHQPGSRDVTPLSMASMKVYHRRGW